MDEHDFSEFETPTSISLYTVLDALLDDNQPLHASILYRLSDLDGDDVEILAGNWATIPLERRLSLMEDLPALAEKDYVLSYEAIGRIATTDADPRVRFGGVQAFIASECDNPELIPLLLNLVESDPDIHVRASAASALGQFIYLGEMEELHDDVRISLENRLLAVANLDEQAEVRRRALESLGFSSREDVIQMIAGAYRSGDVPWIASALLAMGRSADDRWQEDVLASLSHANHLVRMEAVRAAGELSLVEARPTIIGYLDESDPDIRFAAIWSLSQIGGKQVPELLARQLKSSRDDEEIGFIEQALENLAFNSEIEGGMGMFLIPELDELDTRPGTTGWEDEFDLGDELPLDEDDDLEEMDPLDRWSIESLIDDDDDMDDDEDLED